MIEMFAIDGGDHGDDGREQKEAAVAFIGFHDEIFAFAELGGGAGLIDAAADDESGIKMRSRQNGRNDGSGGGFSMRAGDGDAVFQAHQLREHFGARDDRNFHLVRFDDFGIAGGNGGGSDHHVRAVDIDRLRERRKSWRQVSRGAR